MNKADAIRLEKTINTLLGRIWGNGRYMIYGAIIFVAIILSGKNEAISKPLEVLFVSWLALIFVLGGLLWITQGLSELFDDGTFSALILVGLGAILTVFALAMLIGVTWNALQPLLHDKA